MPAPPASFAADQQVLEAKDHPNDLIRRPGKVSATLFRGRRGREGAERHCDPQFLCTADAPNPLWPPVKYFSSERPADSSSKVFELDLGTILTARGNPHLSACGSDLGRIYSAFNKVVRLYVPPREP